MAKSKRSLEGYLFIDNGEFGVPESMILAARAAGKDVPMATKGVYESGTYTCCHCHGQVIMSPRRTYADRNYCMTCGKYYCHLPGCRDCNHSLNAVLDQLQEHAFKFAGREDNPESRIVLTDL